MDKRKIVSPIERKIRHFIHLRWASRLAVVLATATSVWANWLHSEKDAWPIAINILPPLIVLAGFEFTAHVPAWEGPWWHPRRWVRPLAMVGITGIGAWLSYWHQKAAFLTYSKDEQTALLLPLAIDGLMIIASVAVLDLNIRIDQLVAYRDAGQINTYTLPVTKKPEAPKPLKKEAIVDILRNSPTFTLQDVAGRANATLPYVNAIARELGDPRATEPRRRRSRRNPELAVATATTSVA